MKKKIIIILSITILIVFSILFFYRQFGPDISMLLSYEAYMPVPDETIYRYEEFGRDGDYYRVVKYSDRKLKKIKWNNYLDDYYDEKICKNNTELELQDGNLLHFFEKNETPKDYQPKIDENTQYYIKKPEDKRKRDYLLMINNPNENIVYIYEFYI